MEEITYQVIRSNRRTVAIEITGDGQVLVRSPRKTDAGYLHSFVRSKAGWIRKRLSAMGQTEPLLKPEELQALSAQAADHIPQRVAHFAQMMGLTYGRVTIRAQRTRWGSCSAKGNLNFNCLLMLVPPEVLDYVVVHELCHRREMNHSSRFWEEVALVCPAYRKNRKWLTEHGRTLIRRLG